MESIRVLDAGRLAIKTAGRGNVGTGPYKLAAFTPGERVVLARNHHYWATKEPWDRVEFQFIPQATSSCAR